MTAIARFRPRRSCLYVPGANARAMEKAKTLPADAVILDLEDAVAPDAKTDARDAVLAAVGDRAYGAREVLIRVNGLDTGWGRDDLAMAASAGVDGVVVPKVTRGKDVRAVDRYLKKAGASPDLGLWVMIETPLAVLNIKKIAKASAKTRLTGFVMGTNDLAREYQAVPTPDRLAFLFSLSAAVVAARAYGLAAIDGVYNDIKNEAGLAAECEQGRVLGFDGKTLIHPSQIEVANRIFSPGEAELGDARAVVEAFALPENQGRGVISLNGQMVELLHLAQAERLIAIDDAIRKLAS
ncbi:MAG: HpcH/HpaI aldolase/citrate lyase family protein [Gammaproteobacteria bacterium]|nr:HpcH/HpaI aldolase/citrate lyase family protein [Gammaproteobacteria bacterium]